MNTDTHYSKPAIKSKRDRLDLPDDATLLGTDAEGTTHYYSQAANRIIVVDAADLIVRYDLSRHSLLTWVTYISIESGWRDLSDAEEFLDALAESLVAR